MGGEFECVHFGLRIGFGSDFELDLGSDIGSDLRIGLRIRFRSDRIGLFFCQSNRLSDKLTDFDKVTDFVTRICTMNLIT